MSHLSDADYRTEYLVKMAMDASPEEILRLSVRDIADVFAMRDGMARLMLALAVRQESGG